MSMVQDLEAVRADFGRVSSEFEAFKADMAARIAGMDAEKGALVAAHSEALRAVTVRAEAAEESLVAAREEGLTLQSKLAAVEAERQALTARAEHAEKKLDNPAFKDAAMDGRKDPLAEGAEVQIATGTTPTWDEFNKITDPAARTEFWTKNEAKLRAEMAAANKG